MKQRRTRKEQSRDRQQHYGGLAEKEPDAQAAKRFIRQAYSSCKALDNNEDFQHPVY